MTNHNVILYEVPGADPTTDRIVTDHGDRRTTLVAADPSAIVAAAVDAADGGADRIELCGGLGPVWQARVRAAVGDRVPVGAVMYGFESLAGAADYQARYGNEHLRSAFLYVHPGADPDVDRTVVDGEHDRAYLVAVPDPAAAPAVAAHLVDDEGVRLLELYGGFDATDVARVIEAIDARAPVGFPNYG
jgi:hypothetical protein